MPVKVKKSLIGSEEQFKGLIEAHLAEMIAWRKQEIAVAEQGDPPAQPRSESFRTGKGVDQESFNAAMAKWREKMRGRFEPYKRPVAHPLVAEALGFDDERGFFIDYEIEDDLPPPPSEEEILRAKKTALIGAVSEASARAIDALMPTGKRPLFQLKIDDIRAKDRKLLQDLDARVAEQNRKAQKATRDLTKGQISKEQAAEITEQTREAIEAIYEESGDTEALVRARRSQADNETMDAFEKMQADEAAIMRKAAEAQSDIEDLTLEDIDAYEIPPLI